MAYEVQTAAIAAVAGLISGGVSSLVAPWVNWRLTEKKALREDRTGVVLQARTLLADLGTQPGATRLRLQREPAYLNLRPQLLPDEVARIETNAGDKGPLDALREAIDALERRWKLR